MRSFREGFLSLVDSTGVSLKRVAEQTGVSYEQLKKLNQREDASTNVEDAIKLSAFFGVTVEEVVGDASLSDRLEIARMYSQLSERERAILRAAGQSPGGGAR